jgi:hypothetical protein
LDVKTLSIPPEKVAPVAAHSSNARCGPVAHGEGSSTTTLQLWAKLVGQIAQAYRK